MKKILIADDQIPDPRFVDDSEIVKYYTQKYGNEDNFADDFVFMKNLIVTLSDSGYNVHTARVVSEVLSEVKSNSFDCIILDLRWYTDPKYKNKTSYGFTLAQQIRDYSSAPIIMFSNRFPDKNDLAQTAAELNLLPVYKTSNDTCVRNLLVSIKYATAMGQNIATTINDKKTVVNFQFYKILSYVLIACISITSIITLIGFGLFLGGILKSTDLKIMIPLGSNFLSAIIFTYIKFFDKQPDTKAAKQNAVK